jgi:hypothetical protein
LVFGNPNKPNSKARNMVELCGGDENVIANEYGIVETTKVSGKKHRRPNEPNEKRSVQT